MYIYTMFIYIFIRNILRTYSEKISYEIFLVEEGQSGGVDQIVGFFVGFSIKIFFLGFLSKQESP